MDLPERDAWRTVCDRYRTADDAVAWGQLASCIVPLAGLWALMILSLQTHYAVTLLLSLPASLVFIRLFMLQHDMGHGSLFKTPWLNDVVGILVCVPLLTPYWEWRKSHALHHGNTSKLETRILADIYTMTLAEWQTSSTAKRLGYRLFRSVPMLMGVAPSWTFLVSNRIKGSMCKGLPRGRNLVNVHLTTLAFCLWAFANSWFIGLEAFISLQAPIVLVGGAIGIWIFYMEHNHEQTWLSSSSSWSHEAAALRGSSFCLMPFWLAWATANVGYHHIHHLDSRIPNYRLRACHEDNPELFAGVPSYTVMDTLRSMWSLRLYDEATEKLVPFP
ncbi:MAG: fatty acid desaturase [Deltaproteobacteria bacterium]|nr:fatty acid desaturase [Deltaproteobacteria bacterium]